MTDIGLDTASDAVKRCIASFVGECKLSKHLPERFDKCVDFLFGFEPHGLFLFGRATLNSTVSVSEMQQIPEEAR